MNNLPFNILISIILITLTVYPVYNAYVSENNSNIINELKAACVEFENQLTDITTCDTGTVMYITLHISGGYINFSQAGDMILTYGNSEEKHYFAIDVPYTKIAPAENISIINSNSVIRMESLGMNNGYYMVVIEHE